MIPINRQRAIDDFILFTTPQPFDTRPCACGLPSGKVVGKSVINLNTGEIVGNKQSSRGKSKKSPK